MNEKDSNLAVSASYAQIPTCPICGEILGSEYALFLSGDGTNVRDMRRLWEVKL